MRTRSQTARAAAARGSLSIGILFACLAGACAALASVFGKLATDLGDDHVLFAALGTSAPSVRLLLRTACMGGLAGAQVAMWAFFVRALNAVPSLVATVCNTATNFLLSAVVGGLVFNEPLSFTWACGALLIAVGVVLITDDQRSAEKVD